MAREIQGVDAEGLTAVDTWVMVILIIGIGSIVLLRNGGSSSGIPAADLERKCPGQAPHRSHSQLKKSALRNIKLRESRHPDSRSFCFLWSGKQGMPAQIQPSGIMPGQRLMVLTEQKKPWSASPSKSVRHVVVDIVPAQLFHEVRDIRLVVDQQTFHAGHLRKIL